MVQALKTISISIFSIYVVYFIIRYGILPSISESYYRLTKTNEKYGWIFTLFCFGFAFPVAIVASNLWITPAAMLICLVGVARAFKDNKTFAIAHQIGAYGGVALSQVGIWVYYDKWYITVIFSVISILLILFRKKLPIAIIDGEERYTHILFIEIIAFLSIYLVI